MFKSLMQIPIELPRATDSRLRRRNASGVPLAGCATGVGHPEKSLPDVRSALARSAQIGGPESISHRLHVSAYSGEPFTSVLDRNLFSKDN